MGQEIVYCFRCLNRITSSDFEKGKAFRFGGKCACLACAKAVLASLPPGEREALDHQMLAADPKKSSSTSLPSLHPPSSAQIAAQRRAMEDSSKKMKAVGQRPAPPGQKSAWAVTAVAIAALILVSLLVVFVALGSGRPAPRTAGLARKEEPEPASQAPSPAVTPEPPRPEPLSPRPGPPARPADTPAGELVQIDEQVRALCGKEEFRQAVDLVQAIRNRHAKPEWSTAIDDRLQQIEAIARRKSYARVRDQALEAKRRGAEDEVKRCREQVARWGLPGLCEDLEKVLAGNASPKAPPDTPPPFPPPASLSKDAMAYVPRWEKAIAAAAVRDYEAAILEVEEATKTLQDAGARSQAGDDLQILRQAATVWSETFPVLAKWPRGRNLAVGYLDEGGKPQKIDEPVLRVEPSRAELRGNKGSVWIEFGEIAAASIAELFRSRPNRKPLDPAQGRPESDARAAALFCLLEGDAEAARKLDPGPLPQRYVAAGGRLAAASAASPREAEARKIFSAAGEEYRAFASRADSLPVFKKLLGDYADTAFVRRNRASISSRLEGGKEYFFAATDLAARGLFRPGRLPEGRVGWTNDEDVTDKARRAENYIDLDFSTLPDAEYKAWIYAGACCIETFSFSFQTNELTAPDPANPKATVLAEPGEAGALPVNPAFPFFPRTHASHSKGRKEPTRWEWIPLPLPKYADPGPKKARLLSDQQGFTGVYALVTSLRKAPPKDAELLLLKVLAR